MGARVVGPASNVTEARRLTEAGRVDGAILDVCLGDEPAFSFADELARKNIPVVFASGASEPAVPERHRGVGLFAKPATRR